MNTSFDAFLSMGGLIRRWIAFNGVGSLGILVHLGILAILLRRFDVPYLWATAIAVECAVLHNFLWHQRWTWRDRPSSSGAQIVGRLWRFHVLNGFVSLAGNLAIARVLTGEFHADPLASNIAAIMVCSMLNFAVSELFVFRRAGAAALVVLMASSSLEGADPRTPPRHPSAAAALGAPPGSSLAGALRPAPLLFMDGGDPCTPPGSSLAGALRPTPLLASAETGSDMAELRAATLQAWTAYGRQVDARLQSASAGSNPFFALDAQGIKEWKDAAMTGAVAMHRLDRPQPGGATVSVPDGKIHHWAGAIFVPGMTVEAVLQHLAKYAGRESEHYDDVVASRLISRDGDTHKVFLKLRRTKIVTVTYNTEHTVEYRRLGTSRATARSVSTRIAELSDAGTPREREKPDGRDQGFLWRLNAYWRYEAVKGGVLIECESISLSRDVPTLLKLFIGGMVEGVARESLERTLGSLRRALV